MIFDPKNELILLNDKPLPYGEYTNYKKYSRRNEWLIKWPFEFDEYEKTIFLNNDNHYLKSKDDEIIGVYIYNLPNGLQYKLKNQNEIFIWGKIKPFNEQFLNNLHYENNKQVFNQKNMISERQQLSYAGENYWDDGRIKNWNYVFKIKIFLLIRSRDYETFHHIYHKPYHLRSEHHNYNHGLWTQKRDYWWYRDKPYRDFFEYDKKENDPNYILKFTTKFENNPKLDKDFDRSNTDMIYDDAKHHIPAYCGSPYPENLESKPNISNIYEIKNLNIKESRFEFEKTEFNIILYNWIKKNQSLGNSIITSSYWLKFLEPYFVENGDYTYQQIIDWYNRNYSIPEGILCTRKSEVHKINLEEIHNEKLGVLEGCAYNRNWSRKYIKEWYSHNYNDNDYQGEVINPDLYKLIWKNERLQDKELGYFYIVSKTFLFPLHKDFDFGHDCWRNDHNGQFTPTDISDIDEYIKNGDWISYRDSSKLKYS